MVHAPDGGTKVVLNFIHPCPMSKINSLSHCSLFGVALNTSTEMPVTESLPENSLYHVPNLISIHTIESSHASPRSTVVNWSLLCVSKIEREGERAAYFPCGGFLSLAFRYTFKYKKKFAHYTILLLLLRTYEDSFNLTSSSNKPPLHSPCSYRKIIFSRVREF
jgi:hypothetical protein